MKTFLISGAAGFIGSFLVDNYLKKGNRVIAVDNLSTGNIVNLKNALDNSNFKFINKDIIDLVDIDEKVDYILHFASPASPLDYMNLPIETLRVGSIGTENLLKIALKNKSTILLASTSEIYGDPLEHPQNENYYGNVNSFGPRVVYDEAKRYLEAIGYAYLNKYKIDLKIARIFNTYGPRMKINDGRAIPTFLNQLLNDEDFTVFGDGMQTRSFCYVSDTILGIDKLLNSNYNSPVNIGNPNEITLIDLINQIKKLKKSSNKVVYKKLPINDPMKRKPDISLAKKILNWEPIISLDYGLDKTFNYFKKIK